MAFIHVCVSQHVCRERSETNFWEVSFLHCVSARDQMQAGLQQVSILTAQDGKFCSHLGHLLEQSLEMAFPCIDMQYILCVLYVCKHVM